MAIVGSRSSHLFVVVLSDFCWIDNALIHSGLTYVLTVGCAQLKNRSGGCGVKMGTKQRFTQLKNALFVYSRAVQLSCDGEAVVYWEIMVKVVH